MHQTPFMIPLPTTCSTRATRADDAAWRNIGEEAAVLSTEANRLRLLNDVGSFVWARCDGRTLGEIITAVGETFEVAHEQAQADVLRFAGDLAARGLLVLSEDAAEIPILDNTRGPTDL